MDQNNSKLYWWFYSEDLHFQPTPKSTGDTEKLKENDSQNVESQSTSILTLSQIKSKDPKTWHPFSTHDASRLEQAYQKCQQSDSLLVEDVPVLEDYLYTVRVNSNCEDDSMMVEPHYWDYKSIGAGRKHLVRRACWFYKSDRSTFVPLKQSLNNALQKVCTDNDVANCLLNAQLMLDFGQTNEMGKRMQGDLGKHELFEELKQRTDKRIEFSLDLDEQAFDNNFKLVFSISLVPIKKPEQRNTSEPQAEIECESDFWSSHTLDSCIWLCEKSQANSLIKALVSAVLPATLNPFGKSSCKLVRGFGMDLIAKPWPPSQSNLAVDWSELERKLCKAQINSRLQSDSEEEEEEKRAEEVEKGENKEESQQPALDPLSLANNTPSGITSSPTQNCYKFNHLIFVIHGMGQKFAESSGNPQRSILASANSVREKLKSAAQFKARLPNAPPLQEGNNIMVLPVLWRINMDMSLPDSQFTQFLKGESPNSDQKEDSLESMLKDITLPSLPMVRQAISEVIFDVIMYMQPFYRNRIINLILEEMNCLYKKFVKRHPDFTGGVSLMSHSLGSIIAFDILRDESTQTSINEMVPYYQQLEFKVSNLFVLGSPVAVFLSFQGKKFYGCKDRLPRTEEASTPSIPPFFVQLACRNFYNVFHPLDPISYRVEPTICRWNYPSLPVVIQNGIDASNPGGILNFVSRAFWKTTSAPKSNQKDSDEEVVPEVTPCNTPSESYEMKSLVTPPPSKEESTTQSNSKNTTEIWLREHFNDLGRVDFALNSTGPSFSPHLLSAPQAHTAYWKDPDVIAFILERILHQQ